MVRQSQQNRALWLTLCTSFVAGAAASVAIETALSVLRWRGHVPSNLSNQPTLTVVVFLMCGTGVGFRLRSHYPPLALAVPVAIGTFVAVLVGEAAGITTWAVVDGLVSGRETGMALLSIPFLWVHGTMPLLAGMGAAIVVSAVRDALRT